jgi:Pro-kumamolisin, activation domain
MTRKSLLGLWCVLLVALIATSLPAYGRTAPHLTQSGNEVGPSPRITQAINENAYMPLAGNTRPEAKNAVNYRGPVAASLEMDHIFLFLQRSPQQEQALNKLIDQLNDRKSSNFHKWLTAEEFGEQFGVAQSDIDTVTGWLQSHGFRINQVYPSGMLIDFSGTAGQIGEAFHAEIGQLEINGETHIANMSDPQIPIALTPVIKGFASLNDFKPHPMYKVKPDYTFGGCATLPTNTGTRYALTPQDNQTIYNLNPLYGAGISGQGQTIALVEDTDTYNGAADWNTYRTTFGLNANFPLGTYTQVHPGGCTDPGTNGDDGEAAIDVEVASAIAPSAAIELISCAAGNGGTTFGGLIAMQNLVNGSGPYPGVMSVSYGVCEAFNGNGGNAAFYNTYQQAAAEGISVFGASGDEGPSSCSADFGVNYDVTSLGISGWTSTPYNVSVGGTDFEDTYNAKFGGPALSTYWSSTNSSNYGSALSYIPEIPWNDSCASVLISEYVFGSFTTYGSSGFCNNATGDTTYLILAAGSGGASNCYSGAGGTTTGEYGLSQPGCQGLPKPTWQSGSTLVGGKAVYGSPSDGVRDIPDVSMFAANGIWGHFETVCWSDPTQTSGGAASCSGAPSTWSGFGGTSVASPTMAGIQALINQVTGTTWGNPNPVYYQIGQNEYGTAGGTFAGTSCNSSGSGGPAAGCAFNDITQGDIDVVCEYNGTTGRHHCYRPSGTRGADSTDVITAGGVIFGGSGYTSAPTCAIAAPTNNQAYKTPTGTTLYAGGTQATCTATVSTSTTTAVWTVLMSSTSGVGDTIILTNPGGTTTCGPYTLAGASTTAMASGLVTSIGSGCSLATAASSGATATITARTAGAAGNFITEFGPATQFNAFYVYITNTTKGQGPNYVSGITISGGGSGYQPETPITLTGVGTGAVAVANTSPSTAASTYQPAYGAAPGYDMATGLGSPNAANLVSACIWYPNATQGIFSPVANSTLGGSSVAFQWGPYSGATNYWLDVGSTSGGNNYEQSGPLGANACSLTVKNLPTDGSTVYVTWWYFANGAWSNTEYQYTAFGGGSQIATMSSPTPGSTLTGSSQLFTWNAGTLSTAYEIDAGSTSGGNQYFQSGNLGTATSHTVTNLPTNGSTIYITLWSLLNGNWVYNEYQYIAAGSGGSQGVLTTPAPGTQFTGSTVTFDWTAGAGASNYWLDVGSSSGGNQYFQSGPLGNVLTVTVNGLPTDGSTVYATLYTLVGGNWLGTTYTYTAFGYTLGMMQSPTPGTTLSGNVQTFTWSAGSGATAYWMDIGSTIGGNDIYQSGNLGNVLTTTVYSLPADGSQIYVTLYSLVGGNWLNNQYTYISGP